MIASRFMGRQVLLTCAALFFLALSLSMFWYHLSYTWVGEVDTTSGEYRYAMNYYTTEYTPPSWWEDQTYTYSQQHAPMSDLMLIVQIFAITWFLIALLFLGLCLLDERRNSIIAGWMLIAASVVTVSYFVLRAADVVGSGFSIQDLHVAGFIGTSRNDAGSFVTTGPMAGFWLATVASALQIAAVILRVYVVRSAKRKKSDPEPKELRDPDQ